MTVRCDECDKLCATKEILQNHYLEEHRDLEPLARNDPDTGKKTTLSEFEGDE